MIKLADNSFMLTRPDELPASYVGVDRLFMDFETTSGDPKEPALQPYKHSKICGIAVSVDDDERIYYIPIRHNGLHAQNSNLPIEAVRRWLRDVVGSCKDWINHNVLFDAHFAAQEGTVFDAFNICQDGAIFGGRLVDTVVLAKLHYSDRFTGYDLDSLSKEWLGLEGKLERHKTFLKEIKSEDYGDVPPDMLGEYACHDVRLTRLLYKFVDGNKPAECAEVYETEIKLTAALFDIEREGMRVNEVELKVEKFKALNNLIGMADELQEMLGFELNPKSSQQVQDYLCVQSGLPVLMWKENKDYNADDPDDVESSATFDKKALALYEAHPVVRSNATLLRVVQLIRAYRSESQFLSLFVDPYLNLHSKGILHPSYNQIVRTGRMACRNPNAQQLNSRAKSLIHPPPGFAFLSYDYSQIEFRIIVHYIEDVDAIRAYNNDPTTDFHQWIADLVGIERKPGKVLNFAISFGAGKAKILSMLMADPDIIAPVSVEVQKLLTDGSITADAQVQVFTERCEKRARDVYATYHERMPGLKRCSYQASDACRRRGFIFCVDGRRRHLEDRASHRAFNSVIQGSAAGMMKERLVAVSPRYNKWIRDHGIRVLGNVHDETPFIVPLELAHDVSVQRELKRLLEDTRAKLRVPVLCEGGIGEKSWAECSYEKGDIVFENGKQVAGKLKELK